MPESNQQHERTPEVPAAEVDQIKKILSMCQDSPGYLCFFGIMSKDRDKDGRNIINYEYRRFQFSFEDVKLAIDEFVAQFRDDISKL